MKWLWLVALMALPLAAQGAGNPLAGGDAKTGKVLVKKADCDGCHVSIVGGDGTGIYKRAERKVKSVDQLLTQVRFCNSQLGTRLFPEEEVHVAAYLNATYYHFK